MYGFICQSHGVFGNEVGSRPVPTTDRVPRTRSDRGCSGGSVRRSVRGGRSISTLGLQPCLEEVEVGVDAKRRVDQGSGLKMGEAEVYNLLRTT